MLAMPSPPPDTIPERPILVVDDDAKIVRLVRTYLERDGFSVVTAADGPGALDAIERHRPALVVLDLMLPELDGRAVIRAVRRDDEAGATPILIISARGSTPTTTCRSHSRRPSWSCGSSRSCAGRPRAGPGRAPRRPSHARPPRPPHRLVPGR